MDARWPDKHLENRIRRVKQSKRIGRQSRAARFKRKKVLLLDPSKAKREQQRSTKKGRRADAQALAAEEGRDKLRKAAGRRK